MGKSSSSSSCLKIIACGSHDVENDDVIHPPQAKALSDKRGWSFRKRSGRHRVLGNNASSENVNVNNKEIPSGVSNELPVKSNNCNEKPPISDSVEKAAKEVTVIEHVSEPKTSVVTASENDSSATSAKLQVPHTEVVEEEVVVQSGGDATPAEAKSASLAAVSENVTNAELSEPQIGNDLAVAEVDTDTTSSEPKLSESVVALENGDDASAFMDEPVAIIVQTAIRGFLAQVAFCQLKCAIKLQAAVRGHLVRRDAVETLHCIRAIVKVQSLVRAHSSKSLDNKHKASNAQFSTVNLLRNSFARQLLESTQKPKSVNIRCDPLRPNSAWGWLERWMSVSTSETEEKIEPDMEPQDDNQIQETAVPANAESGPTVLSDLPASKFNISDVAESQKSEENHIIHDVNIVDTTSFDHLPTEVEMEQSHPEKTDAIEVNVGSINLEALAYEGSHVQADPISLVDRTAVESMKMSAYEELDDEGEGKKFAYGSRKASNPAFIAAQSKFEGLSAAAESRGSVDSSHQNVGAESHVDRASVEETFKKLIEPTVFETAQVDQSCVDTVSSAEETVQETFRPVMIETDPVDSHSHATGSACGTELSISSTLDSPVRSDMGNAEVEQNRLSESSCDAKTKSGSGIEADGMPRHYATDLMSILIHQEEAQTVNGTSVDVAFADVGPQEEQKLEKDASDLQANIQCVNSVIDSLSMEQKHELNGFNTQPENVHGIEHQGDKLSPEASPKSHRTVPESQGTPSSQVSVKSKKKNDKSGPNTKRSSLSTGKKTPSKSGHNSGARSSTENLSKDHKSGKRRNSFGSSKSDNVDQEPKEGTARSSLPSYMQATESARAKAHSPRSSPDVYDKEVSSKKRHSLPGPTERQDSPRIQRSTSQTAQGAKTNGSHERKWQR